MKKYIVKYISSTDDDVCGVWTTANSEKEAIQNVRDEYWDIKEIVDCYVK